MGLNTGQDKVKGSPKVNFSRPSELQQRKNVVHVSRPNEVENARGYLPIIDMEMDIMEAIKENSVVIIRGETR
ncbi:hypothetical protein RchiOBHm_Chr4g0386421 [Rosa chinensis]|uniref:Uncharacterized protein n=1 Tax=Rosa chinensis TaxID=74649 RepID=A0A2P6QPA0_ROSCH|nr:hypothetical protein RchiOBHm_Chr4g0386421 [Rosa chinensis]